jgi:hypothetical protein
MAQHPMTTIVSTAIPHTTLLVFAAVILVAGLVHGTLGLGFPLVATPLLALWVDVQTAILVTLLPTVAVNIISLLRGGNWHESIGRYWPLAAYAVFGSMAGTYILIVNDPHPFKLVLAGLIFMYLGAGRIGARSLTFVPNYPRASMLLFGLGAGLAAGMSNVMVPLLIIYALEMGLAKTAMVQVFNLCFFAGKVAQIGVFGGAGMLSTELISVVAPLALVAVIGLAVGMVVRDRIAAETYRRAMRRVLFIFAVLLVGQFLIAL